MKKFAVLFLVPLFFLLFLALKTGSAEAVDACDPGGIPLSLTTTRERQAWTFDINIGWNRMSPDKVDELYDSEWRVGLYTEQGSHIPSSLDGKAAKNSTLDNLNAKILTISNIASEAQGRKVFVHIYPSSRAFEDGDPSHPFCFGEINSPSFNVPSGTSTPVDNSTEPGTAKIIYPDISALDGATDFVTVLFNVANIPDYANKKFYVCPKSTCEEDNLIDIQEEDLADKESGEFPISFCGDNEDTVKASKLGNEDEQCDPNDDYFHEQRTYYISLYGEDKRTFLEGVSFFVKHSYPIVGVVPSNDFKPNSEITVNISRSKLLAGGGDRNNYQVTLKSLDERYAQTKCVTIEGEGVNEAQTVTFPHSITSLRKDDIPLLLAGDYLLEINEQVDEGANDCDGGFSYYYYDIKISPDGGTFTERKDPNGSEADEEVIPSPPPLPCLEGEDEFGVKVTVRGNNPSERQKDEERIVHCTKVGTALGAISVTPNEVIGALFAWILGIAGVSAFLLFLFAGYNLMTSGGNKEKVQAAREVITSAIVGLLFIIFSVVILEFIGVDVLRIPGLGK